MQDPALTRLRPLRFGVMVPSSGVTSFARACVADVLRDYLGEVVLLIVDPSLPTRSSGIKKLKSAIRLNGNLWHLNSRLFPPSQIEAYQSVPLESFLPDVPRRVCEAVTKGKFSQFFKQEDVTFIRSLDLDFILKFSYGIIRGDILSCSRYGVWSYHHGDETKYRGGPPAFWEIVRGDPVTGVVLQKLTDALDAGVVLKKSYAPTVGRSYRSNLQQIQTSSSHMVRLVCLDILHGAGSYINNAPSDTTARIYRAPNDLQMLQFWGRLAMNWVRYKIANQRVDEWNVGVVEAHPSVFLQPDYVPQIEWTEYTEKHQMVADPFLLPSAREVRILVEEFHWFNETGRIAEIRRGSDGKLSGITTAIDPGVHMSYPYVFEHEGDVYCIPETAKMRQVRLYRLSSDGEWYFLTTLLKDIEAVDSTVFFAQGSWWLLSSLGGAPGAWSLYIWNAPQLTGPWTPHPGNPVKTDVRSARPAGNPFWHQGHLYRPAQDGRNSYGGGLAINRIDVLSMAQYRETTVRYITPAITGRYSDGIHTLSSFGDRCALDAKRHTWPTELLACRFLARIRGERPNKPFGYRRMTVLPAVLVEPGRSPQSTTSGA